MQDLVRHCTRHYCIHIHQHSVFHQLLDAYIKQESCDASTEEDVSTDVKCNSTIPIVKQVTR